MKRILRPLGAMICFASAYAQSFAPIQSESEVKELLDFLVSTSEDVGFTYQGSVGALSGLTLPLSYYSTATYWGEYVGNLPGNNLSVTDVYNPGDYTLTPDTSTPGANLQAERVNAFYGTDIYDGSCWQIALALCAKNNLTSPSGENLFTILESQDKLLMVGYDGNAPQTQPGANRATTKNDDTFSYNGQSITDPTKAYFFRMVTRNWLSHDPFMGTEYIKYVTADNLPPNPDYQKGMITWQDWKPITGENAWGLFIGPLQSASLKKESAQESFIPFSSDSVQNALGTLYALSCMQSQLGGVYYACKGSLGNQGSQPVDPFEVSVENNASTLGGLLIFKQVLTDELAHDPNLSSDQKSQIQAALATINTMINGGKTPQGKSTKGILRFFKENAWDSANGIFYQGGDANNPEKSSDWVPTVEPKAVDVNTWGVSVLGQPLIDSWYGFGSCYTLWQNVKSWGGFYGPDQTLWGVGYSDQDGNGSNGNYENGIISAEWTAGAINMTRCLITQYQNAVSDPSYSQDEQQKAAAYVQDLKKDHDSMFQHLMTLRTDQYQTQSAYANVRPKNYEQLIPIPAGKLSFVYASKRYMIPFGWFANPIPSLTSTSWSLMLHYNFNPFSPNGSYNAPFSAEKAVTDVVLEELPTLATLPSHEDLFQIAKNVSSEFQGKFNWEDFVLMIEASQRGLKDFALSQKEEQKHVKLVLKHVVDLTDTPYLPDGFTDLLYKSMIDPFVDVVLPVDGFAFTMQMREGCPTEEDAKDAARAMSLKLNSRFHWNTLGELVLYSLHLAKSYSCGTSYQRASFAKDIVRLTLDQTDTCLYPEKFIDWIFKKLAFSMIDRSFG